MIAVVHVQDGLPVVRVYSSWARRIPPIRGVHSDTKPYVGFAFAFANMRCASPTTRTEPQTAAWVVLPRE